MFGHELKKGSAELLILALLEARPRHGYELAKLIEKDEDTAVPRGALDITLYRDDLQTIGPKPVIGETRIPGDLSGKHVVIVDDVLYTGRTVRAALDELADFGRPKRISLCVLVDRGGRELAPYRRGPRRLEAGEIWLHSPYEVRSWDSRYFGPVPISNIKYHVAPLLTQHVDRPYPNGS